jgi:hypothetical protein
MAALKTVVSVLHIPEGKKIGEALDGLGEALTGLSGLCLSVAQSVEDFARGVQETQDAIRRLLDRLSLDGLWDTVKGIFTGDVEKILREVAHDVGAVLNNFQQLVKGYVGLLDELIGLLGDAATAFEKWIRPILVAQFGDRIGGALAGAVTLYTDFEVGVASGLIGTVSGVVSMLDPDTWKGMAELAASVAADPSKLPGVLENMGKQFVAWDKWSGDHPGRAAGEAAFNIASLFVPGGALSKTGTVAKGLKITKGLLEEGKLGQLGKLSEFGSKTSKLDGLDDLSRVGSKVPEIPEVKPTPGIPESVVNPKVPNTVDTPPSPHGLERPPGPPDPPGPTGTRGDHGTASGDGPPPEPPGRATGPSESGPGRTDGPATQSPGSAGPVDAPHGLEPSEPGHAASPGDRTSPGANTPESSSPPSPHDDGRTPSDHGQPSTNHEAGTPEEHNSGHGEGAGHRPSDNHSPGSVENNGRPDERAHTPTDHRPAHVPETPHGGPESTTPHTAEQSRASSDGNAGRHDPGPATPVGVPGGAMPPATHAPGPSLSPADSAAAASKTPTPEATTRNPESKAPQGISPEGPRTQPTAATGPAPGSTPTAPVKPAPAHLEAGATSQPGHPGPESPAQPRPGGHERDSSSAPPDRELHPVDAPPVDQHLESPWDGPAGEHAAHLLPSDDSGYRIHPRDCEFLGISPEQVESWAYREAPLGMTPAEFRDFSNSLYNALAREGPSPNDLDLRLQGSSARFFSGEHKSLPVESELVDSPKAQLLMNDWFGEDANRPLRRPFDSMHRLSLDDEPSDYDIQISSDSMVAACRQRWEANGSQGNLVHPKYGFISKEVFKAMFPALWEWADRWTEQTGRPVVPALFPSSGPPDTTSAGVSSHFRESDWHIHPEGRDSQ